MLNTIVAEAIDALADERSRPRMAKGDSLEEAVLEVVKATYAANKRIVFDGDNYSDEWHAEAEQRGLPNLRTTPDALPWLVEPRPSRCSPSTTCCPSASSSPATRCSSSST